MHVFEQECEQKYGKHLGSIVATAKGEEWLALMHVCSGYIYSAIEVVNSTFTRQQKTTNIKDNEFTVEFKGCTTVKEVKQVYRRLSKQWHPDMPTGDTVKMAKVNEAYENAMSRVA